MLGDYSINWADINAKKQQEKWAKGMVTFFASFTVFVIFYALIKSIIQL